MKNPTDEQIDRLHDHVTPLPMLNDEEFIREVRAWLKREQLIDDEPFPGKENSK